MLQAADLEDRLKGVTSKQCPVPGQTPWTFWHFEFHHRQTAAAFRPEGKILLAARTYERMKPRRKTVEVLRDCPVEGLELAQVEDLPRGVAL